nr:hypothetical protein CFP56_64122 [Quercus suber]
MPTLSHTGQSGAKAPKSQVSQLEKKEEKEDAGRVSSSSAAGRAATPSGFPSASQLASTSLHLMVRGARRQRREMLGGSGVDAIGAHPRFWHSEVL